MTKTNLKREGIYFPVNAASEEEFAAIIADFNEWKKTQSGVGRATPINFAFRQEGPKGTIISHAKPLPRDPDTGKIARTFIANGNVYTRLTVEEGVGITRWTHMDKSKVTIAFARTFQQIYDWIAKGINIANGPITTLGELRTVINTHFRPLLDGIMELGEERFSTAFWMCTLFIVKEGEDIRRWVPEEQEQKIKDWAEEGYSENDFFLLCIAFVKGFKERYQERLEEIQKIEQGLSAVTATSSKEVSG